jgi:hypothetical protein
MRLIFIRIRIRTATLRKEINISDRRLSYPSKTESFLDGVLTAPLCNRNALSAVTCTLYSIHQIASHVKYYPLLVELLRLY